MYEVLDKDTIKSEILPHLSVAKRGYVSKRQPGVSTFNTFFTSYCQTEVHWRNCC